jgi:transcriptional regulator with XRE-family HTH domain
MVTEQEPDSEEAGTIQAMVHMGDQVRIWRVRRAMTQTQLAEKAGVGINTIVRIERNQTEPRPPTIRKLADALGVDPSELVDEG